METAIGTISALHDGRATVVVESAIACRRCASGKGCGAGLLQGNERQTVIDIGVPQGMTIGVGDEVRLTVAPIRLLRAAVLAYGLPLVGIIVALGIGWMVAGHLTDGQGIAVALVGLAAGLFSSRRWLQRQATCDQFVPVFDGFPGAGNE